MNVCLGVHECDLGPEDEAPEGTGEVRIPGGPGIAYAAPFLITHYVTAHGIVCRPPLRPPLVEYAGIGRRAAKP